MYPFITLFLLLVLWVLVVLPFLGLLYGMVGVVFSTKLMAICLDDVFMRSRDVKWAPFMLRGDGRELHVEIFIMIEGGCI